MDEKIKCKCLDCGKTFYKGNKSDNEKYCLRCEREAYLEKLQDDEFLGYDKHELD